MLTLILADTELETIPDKILGHPSVTSSAHRRNRRANGMLLDASLHHSAIRKIDPAVRRGRPDVAHFFMLLTQDSILNQEGLIRPLIHTRNDELITISPETRIPKNYNRFVGLMEDLFQKGVVPNPDTTLLRLEPGMPLDKVLEVHGRGEVVAFSPEGKAVRMGDIFKDTGPDVTCIIGGFTKGDFLSPVHDLCTSKFSIYPGVLKTWTVTSEVLSAYRSAHGGVTG